MTDAAGKPTAPLDTAYRGVPALVLGASGFIGAWTVRALHARGADLTVTVRRAAGASRALAPIARQLRLEIADLAARGAVARLIETSRPAIVFNLAGYGVDKSERDPALMDALNAQLVDELCGALGTSPADGWTGARLVHAGTAAEYGPLDGTIVETSDERPFTDYGRTKLEGTRALQRIAAATGLRAIVVRLFTVYGPGDYPDKLLACLMRAADTGTAVPLTAGRQRRNFTYVEDVAEALLRLGVSAARPGEVVNLGAAEPVSVREFAETAAAVLGFDPALLRFDALPDRNDEMWHGEVDSARLRELTAWMPSTPLAEGIRRSYRFEHEV